MKQAIFLAIFLSLFTGLALAQNKVNKPTDTINGLQLSIEIKKSKESFRPTDILKIGINLTNVGKSPITLYKHMSWGVSSSFFLNLSNEQGLMLIPTLLRDAQDFPPYKKDDFITIEPRQKIEKTTHLDLKHYNITKTGVYRIVVSYASPVAKEYVPKGLKIFSLEEGRLESKFAKLKIRKEF